jgi:hypothetical protein
MILERQFRISQNHWTNLKTNFLTILVISLIASSRLLGQDPFIQHFKTSEGLLSNSVYKIFQDNKHFIWFATDAGVSKYDGSKFDHYRKQDGLSTNNVIDFAEDRFGRVWFFHTNASLSFYCDNLIFNEKNTPYLDSLRSSDYFRKFSEDREGNIYFYAHQNRLIFKLDTLNHVTRYNLPILPIYNPSTSGRAEGLSVNYMNIDANGDFLLWASGGYFRMNKNSENPVLVNDAYRYKDVITASNNKKYILVRKKDSINFQLKRFNEQVHFDKDESLVNTGSKYISAILEDDNGLLWIATADQGVYCYKNNKLYYYIEIKDATSIIQDHENNIWISSLKEGVYKISPFFYQHQHFESSLFNNSGIYALGQNKDGGIWCTNGQLLYLIKDDLIYKADFQRAEKSFDQITVISKNLLLLGEMGKKPYILDGIRINQSTRKITIDHVLLGPLLTNRLFLNPGQNEICSYYQSLLVFTNVTQPFKKSSIRRVGERIFNCFYNSKNELILNSKKNYIYHEGTRRESAELSYFNNKIISDHLNIDDNIDLFNIEGDSLFLLNDKRLYNLTATFAQHVDLAIKHLVYQDSTLFLATSRNLYLCKNPLNILQNKPVELNLIDINFRSIQNIIIKDGRLYIGSDDGLSILPYHELMNRTINSPIPYFNSIQVNDQENLVGQKIVSLITTQRVNIAFGSINYSVNPNIFSYKLEGSDTDWTEVKGSNVVLQNLPKGKYTFKLRARKPASNWSEPVEFGISVNATIWQHPLFYFFVILIFAVIIFLIVLRQKNIELARHEMENQIILLEQKSQQAMMNPHFIFNVLGSIQNYLLRNQPNEAGIYLSQFARLIRQNLKATSSSMINLEEEIDRLKDYLELEKLRMGNKFDYLIENRDGLAAEDLFIPAMIVQPFVENAVWHGISPLEEKGIIRISFRLKDEKSLQIIVEDNGIGIANARKNGNNTDSHLKLGTSIISKRLELLSKKYETETHILFSEQSPGNTNPGTKVEIIVPFLFE